MVDLCQPLCIIETKSHSPSWRTKRIIRYYTHPPKSVEVIIRKGQPCPTSSGHIYIQ